jgi:hypothetical protein
MVAARLMNAVCGHSHKKQKQNPLAATPAAISGHLQAAALIRDEIGRQNFSCQRRLCLVGGRRSRRGQPQCEEEAANQNAKAKGADKNSAPHGQTARDARTALKSHVPMAK